MTGFKIRSHYLSIKPCMTNRIGNYHRPLCRSIWSYNIYNFLLWAFLLQDPTFSFIVNPLPSWCVPCLAGAHGDVGKLLKIQEYWVHFLLPGMQKNLKQTLHFTCCCLPKMGLFNTYTAKPVCWNGWISDSYCSLKPFCLGMGEVVPARTSPTLLPPSPRTVLSLSCFKVLQCINCRDWHCKSLKRNFFSLYEGR